jgi:choline dehydrogenase-like flavoprotein
MEWQDNQTPWAKGSGEHMAMSAGAGDTFDYVIVGSGAAGSVLAHRLTEEPGATVCVLEAGPPDRHPYIHVPAGFIKMLFNPDFTWQFKTEPSEGSGGRAIPTTQGRTLGGVQLDQWHGLQPRAARRSRQLGAARQPRLGLC